ncbi:hypothetical protein GCM10010965_08250 [Caldalkalibacillus thermarum]|uniref:PhzF family phenazine biosynthesis protein n=1 Tax=Caldalkalibacillus thermarum TaxID=296745 RepID=UPI001665C182|nr:PhzF family phenazine biosynthesis protein [Caldalkalibacillus thermarum]GGK17551.1 hypothetical protein GCM10010965_08250 [Caldalkalibacillus thermarum]
MKEICLVKVFHNESIPGNLTGVVNCDLPPNPRDCQSIASRLGLPDTCFVWKGFSGNLLHRTFSPYEELTFCTQTLLASAAALEVTNDSDVFRFETAVGSVTVLRDGKYYWVKSVVEKVRPLEDLSVLPLLGLDEQMLNGELGITGVGRQRLYIPLRSQEVLYSITLSSGTIMHVCQMYGLHGICFFTVVDSGHVALRVFTTSLKGGEDAATGGAAIGLIGYNRFQHLGLAEVVRVDQGHIESEKRGCMFIRHDSSTNQVLLGSFVDVLLRGNLVGTERGVGYGS